MHGCAYVVVDNLLRKSNAERPSLVLCHWSFAAAKRPRERGNEGRGNCQNGRRRPTAGNRGSGTGVRDWRLVARRPWLAARGSSPKARGLRPAKFGGREPAQAGRPGTGKARESAMARRRRRTFGCRPGRAPAPLVISRPKAGARPGLHALCRKELWNIGEASRMA